MHARHKLTTKIIPRVRLHVWMRKVGGKVISYLSFISVTLIKYPAIKQRQRNNLGEKRLILTHNSRLQLHPYIILSTASHHMDPKHQTLVIGLGRKQLDLLSHLGFLQRKKM